MSLPPVSTRVRHFITLATQSVPLIALLAMTGRDLNPRLLLIVAPLAITAAGPLIELSGRRWGWYVTLGGFSLQLAGMLFVCCMVLGMTGSWQYVRWSDLALLTLFLPPLILLVWNWRAGREVPPAPAPVP